MAVLLSHVLSSRETFGARVRVHADAPPLALLQNLAEFTTTVVQQVGGDAVSDLRGSGPSEAWSTLAVSLDDSWQAFVGDRINVGVPASPFVSLEGWLR